MDREFGGSPTADYLWNVKKVVPFLKIDKGLADEKDGVQLMKPMPTLDDLLDRAVAKGIFGTKERSVIKLPGAGLKAVVAQQFEIGQQVLAQGLVPIIEPEVDIKSPTERPRPRTSSRRNSSPASNAARRRPAGHAQADDSRHGQPVPASSSKHPRVLKVVALSGGYSRDEAYKRLARKNGMIASFSRALTEGLTAQQSDEEFNATLDTAIAEHRQGVGYLS